MENLDTCKGVHPIFNSSDFYIDTPMIHQLEEKLHSWLWNGATGGVVLGDYRIGKTRAIQQVSKQLKNRLNENIPVRNLTVKKRDVSTIASIFKNLCYSIELPIKNRATSDEMVNDLIHYFGELSLANSTNQVVLTVDEMQRLNIKQLEAFAELYDGLSEMKINLMVLFVGNYNSSSRGIIEQVMNKENELIRGRFFTQLHQFHGVRNHEDTFKSLLQYDFEMEDHKSITEYFLENEYREGFRLSTLSHQIWNIYEESYKKELNIDSWGMQYFTSMIKTLLVDYLPKYGVENENNFESMIINSISASGLVPNLVTQNND